MVKSINSELSVTHAIRTPNNQYLRKKLEIKYKLYVNKMFIFTIYSMLIICFFCSAICIRT